MGHAVRCPRGVPGATFPEFEREDEKEHVGETAEYGAESGRSE